VPPQRDLRPNRAQVVLGAATVLAYAIGYPVAILADSPIGWGLVTLGGLLLIALGVVTIQRINRSGSDT
jgi:hypothetical protein